jgi:hypothetical protein
MPTHYTKTLLLRSQTKHHSTKWLRTGLAYNQSNDLSAGYGIAQWTDYDRKKGLLDFARKYKYRPDALGLQLGYLNYELENTRKDARDYLKNEDNHNVADLATKFNELYEGWHYR